MPNSNSSASKRTLSAALKRLQTKPNSTMKSRRHSTSSRGLRTELILIPHPA
jgi:hypothetical protein